ncbi:MAG: ATP-binding protein [Oscillospiraceae bacterium]
MKKKKKEKVSLRLTILFTVIVSLIMAASILLAGIIMIIINSINIFEDGNIPLFIAVYIVIICICFAGIATKVVSDKIFVPMIKLNESMKRVAGGDFTVQMNETGMFREVREMIHNFNIMTKELGSNKIIHTDFTRNVSHEMKTPLSTIEGYATLLQDPNISYENRAEYAAKIIQNTKRLSALTGNILVLSKLENNSVAISKKLFSLDEQLRQVVLMYEEVWTEKNIDIDIDDAGNRFDFLGSEELLFQAWQNLVGNALKYTENGGIVRIILRETDDGITVCVKDNGIGISEENRSRIFEKFYQADASHASNGNGLGLAITRKIIELHSGSISVKSESGQGSEFIVSLPE